METAPSYKWDVFVSHGGVDKPWARQVVADWRSHNLRIFFDSDSIDPGASVPDAIREGIKQSKHVVVLLSTASRQSGWVKMEINLAQTLDPGATQQRLIPVLLDLRPADVDESIQRLNCVDLSSPSTRRAEYSRLVRWLRLPADLEPPAMEEERGGAQARDEDDVPVVLRPRSGPPAGLGIALAPPPVAPPAITTNNRCVELVLDGNVEDFTEFEQKKLLRALGELLQISEVRIRSVRPGSVKVVVVVPEPSAEELVDAVRTGRLAKLGVRSAELGEVVETLMLPSSTVFKPHQERRSRAAWVLASTPEQQRASAKSDGRTSQSSLLVMARIRAGHQAALERLLKEMRVPPGGEDLELNPVIPFLRLRTVHFARLLLHAASPSDAAPIPVFDGEPQAHGPPIPAKLLFSTDFDGTLEEHLDELLREAGPGLDQVFGHCEGWPGHADREGAHGFFLLHRVPSNTFYTGTMGRSVDQIRREADLRDRIQRFLDVETETPGFPADPVAIRERIREFAFAEPALAWVREEPGPFPKPIVRNFNRAVIVAAVALLAAAVLLLRLLVPWTTAILVVLGVVAALGAAAFAAFRYLERLAATDPVIIRDTVDDHTAQLVETEDRIVQNEMSSVIYIKEPLWFRGLVLRAVLAFINFSARYLSNQGSLAGIPSIHFARWVIVDDGRRLVFFSNFDGSWENYLGDFIDKSASGLTAVWSNCVGFPRTVGLTGEGARDEQRFKAYSRDSQVPTQVWYSAYRWLSVSNINNNSKIRLGLYGAMEQDDARAWLRRFADGGERAPEPRPEFNRPATAAPVVEVDDVQGLVARSYAALRHAAYVPAAFGADAASARAWVGAMADEVTAAAARSGDVRERGHALNLAFTAPGLRALGMSEAAVSTFSREFQEGMATEHRKRVLGDTGPAAPEAWRWGGPANAPVHAMLFIYAHSPERLAERIACETDRAKAHGVTLREPLGTVMLAEDKEHFGFHDGIAQPRVAGMSSGSGEVPAGEVILGYPNAYGKLPASPSVPESEAARRHLRPAEPDDDAPKDAAPRRDLGRNGTYVVFRQLEQDVRAFWAWADARAGHDAEGRKRLAAKMVGRWPNGAPLVRHPDREPETFDPSTANAFTYAEQDPHGERCPVASHVRRANPRDGMMPNPRESLLVADRHRLLRRGRAYGPPLAPSFDPADLLRADDAANGDRGLHFICFNSDIVRQFEFVQNTWINSMKFDGLYADADPVMGPHADPAAARYPEEVSDFTEPRCPVRHREAGVSRFVTMRGGAYLFMPGLGALRYLAALE